MREAGKEYKDSTVGAAIFSCDKRYRYTLSREWNGGDSRSVNFLMCNPSIATAEILDPTVAGCLKRSIEWGYSRMVVTNIFALRSTDPKGLLTVNDPIGPENDTAIAEQAAKADLVICAWGSASKLVPERAKQVLTILKSNGVQPYALKVSEKTGQPWHPLYLSHKLKPFKWNPEGW